MKMHPTKAPRPDGMPLVFFQKYWHVVGESVTTSILSALRPGDITPTFNHTHIILIPKKDNPAKVNGYRPISLCNMVYKVILKVIANRFKLIIMPKINAET